MKTKETIVTMLFTLLVSLIMALNYFADIKKNSIESVYQVYLNGKIIGYIEDDDQLYSLINKRQKQIKERYNVDEVYPPDDFEIIKTNTYEVVISTPEKIYEKMANLGSFTIEGYTVTIKSEEAKNNKTIYVLEKEIFDEAIQTFISAFLEDGEYTNYVNNTQTEIETTGKTIDVMYFEETLTIKKSYISVEERIYTNAIDLSQLLLFGENYKISTHVVAAGDTIESISEKNKLNPEEFLIANTKYTSADSLLTIGDKVNITLINPILTFTYEVTEVSDAKIPYEEKTVYDSDKPVSYSDITTAGVTGITRITQKYVVKNGETQPGVDITKQEVITEKVDQVTTKGGYKSSHIVGNYVDTGTKWQWPTNYPYVLTSPFGYRWGSLHEGIDISGTGFNSPIYAALDGTVISAGWEGVCGSGGGYCVVLHHRDDYYTVYAHMAKGSLQVSTGDTVSRGQVIGGMGNTGYSFGTHLHFAVWKGYPYRGGQVINPMELWS